MRLLTLEMSGCLSTSPIYDIGFLERIDSRDRLAFIIHFVHVLMQQKLNTPRLNFVRRFVFFKNAR